MVLKVSVAVFARSEPGGGVLQQHIGWGIYHGKESTSKKVSRISPCFSQ